ncbi:MAG: hypothetical protein Fur0034_13220 [Desulfuromonadia bacterium]
MPEQGIVLKDKPDFPLTRMAARGIFPIEKDPPLIRHLKSCHDPEEGRLAGTRRAEQCHQLARGDFKGHIIEGDTFTEAFG